MGSDQKSFGSHASAPRRNVAIWLSLCLVAAGYLLLRQYEIRAQDFYLRWDGAAHFMHGVRVADAIRSTDWSAFVEALAAQRYWPIGQSIFLGSFMSVFGVNPKAAILATDLAGFGSAILLFWIGTRLHPIRGPLCGAYAVANLLVCPIFVARAAEPMAEVPALFLMLLVIASVIHAPKQGSATAILTTGCCLAALFFTRYVYGTVMLALVLSFLLVDPAARWWRGRGLSGSRVARFGLANEVKKLSAAYALLLSPTLALVAVWFLLGDWREQLETIWRALTWRHTSGHFGGLGVFDLNYLREHVFQVREGFHVYDALLLLNITLFAGALTRWRRLPREFWFLLAVFVVFSFLVMIHPLNEARFSLPFFPLFWLMSGLGAVIALGRVKNVAPRVAIAVAVGAAILLSATGRAHDYLSNPYIQDPFTPTRSAYPRKLFELLEPVFDENANVLMLGATGGWGWLSPELVRWELGRKRGRDLFIDFARSDNALRMGPAGAWSRPLHYVVTLSGSAVTPLSLQKSIQKIAESSACFRLQSTTPAGGNRILKLYRVLSPQCGHLTQRSRPSPPARGLGDKRAADPE